VDERAFAGLDIPASPGHNRTGGTEVKVFNRGGLVILSLGILILAPCSVVTAASGKVEVENMRGPLANAWFSAIDPSGCIQTDTFVTANSPTDQHLPGPGTTTDIAAVSIYKYDSCTDTTLLQAIGQTDSLPAGDFQVSQQLNWASLHTTLSMTDIDTGGLFDVTVNVDWVGTGDITRNHSNTNEVYPGCHVLNRWKGSGRDADASGSVSDGVTEFTPGASTSAEIGFVIDGFEVIGCP
jgi:hypothetical protein